MEVAEYIGIGEAAYTKYERGETRITIEIIQKVAEFLKIDPIRLITEAPATYVENKGVTSSPNAHSNSANGDINYVGVDKELINAVIKMMEKMVDFLDRNRN